MRPENSEAQFNKVRFLCPDGALVAQETNAYQVTVGQGLFSIHKKKEEI